MTDIERFMVTQFPLAKAGTEIEEDVWNKRKAALGKQLSEDLPLHRLRASRLEYEFSINPAGVYIRVYLVRSRQLNLPLSGSGNLGADSFLEDIELIQQAQGPALRESYERALKSSVNPAGDAEVGLRRKRLRDCHKTEKIWIPGAPEGEHLEATQTPQRMPHATNAQIQFRVTGVYRLHCFIVISDVLTAKCRPYLDAKVGLPIKVYRFNEALGEGASRELVRSVDSRQLLEASAQIEFAWVDGTVDRISLVGHPLMPRQNPNQQPRLR